MKWVTLISVLLFVGCAAQVKPPERPQEVPHAAVWAGGPDGGAWFVCKEVINKPVDYDCTVYDDYTGDIWAQGRFVLRAYSWSNENQKAVYSVAEPISDLRFSFFDGDDIYLKGSLILLPDGVLDHPFGDGHGKKQRYELGQPVGPESGY